MYSSTAYADAHDEISLIPGLSLSRFLLSLLCFYEKERPYYVSFEGYESGRSKLTPRFNEKS